MKLARKITFALVLLAFAVIAGLETIEVQRELARSALDMQHDHRLLGHTLGGSFVRAWELEGEDEALTLLADANRFQEQVRLSWRWLDSPSAAELPRDQLAALRAGQDTFFVDDRLPPGLLRSFTPVSIGPRRGAIEIIEPLTEQRMHVRQTVVGTAVATGAITLAFLLVAMAMGRRLVGRPVEQLAELAQRIGQGDLEARVHLRQKDELATLADAMNQMAGGLAAARAQVVAETAARLATLEHLRHADRLATVGKLASGMAHELGTPLNVVLGRAKMISTGEAQGDESLECARIISQQVLHMTGIIRQLLDFARRRTPRRTPEDLTQLVERTLALLQPMAARRNIVLATEAPGPMNLEVDAGQLQQAITNLVVNGIQAMKRPGTLRVRLGRAHALPPVELGGPEAEWVRLDVTDEGEGIAPEVLPRIFEPFFTTKDVGEGTGLGLSVSYGLIRDHGGWISVSSEHGRGSCFSIFLPPEAREPPQGAKA
ncbi:sensor histidine kinase [Vitiosangium sp. GDMCC 1.1324]|uniref:sensor histidine kinase n=1 Tax=Vitiosangium sp. (strain GDMCC 1.1324) TaxID=2138576 RepID=UPI000D36794B|nr:HAMP domain-containing sensor histidine kinase [Vitiosangium sp. GDMCC 1.1324]PTL81198.1 two-component sensor histidine kinase [Vitiosangium sp. GDMCC 1.1324]